MGLGVARERESQLRRPGSSHFFPERLLQYPARERRRMGKRVVSPRQHWATTLSPLGWGVAVSVEVPCPAKHRSSPSLGEPAQTLNFSGVQSLRRLVLPITPAFPLDTRLPVALVRQGISCSSFGVSLRERIAAPVPAADGEKRECGQGAKASAPAQPLAEEAAGA